MTRSELLFKIMLLTMNQPHFVATLSIFDFLAYGGCKTVVGFGAQTVGYAAAAIGDRGNVIDCLPPLLTHGPQAIQFIATAATLQEKQNRVATLALTLAGTGCLSLEGDIAANAGAGSFIYLLTKYIDAVAESGSGGTTPYIACASARGARKLSQFTRQEHIQCLSAIAVIACLGFGYIWFLGYCVRSPKKVIQKTRKVLRIPKNLATRSFKPPF